VIRALLLLAVIWRTVAVLLTVAVLSIITGCAELPSMKYCDKVEYTRNQNEITIHAECRAPVGGMGLR
jgi:type IV pilus biogenesis protein CpaD/CtpE